MPRIGEREKALRQQREQALAVAPARPGRVGPMSAAEARAITDRINDAAGRLCDLLAEAHEREAWRALGYSGWSEYVAGEIGVSRQHAYRMVDHGRVLAALREAAAGDLVSPIGDTDLRQGNDLRDPAGSVSEFAAREILPVLPQVTEEVRARREAGEPPEQAVREAVANHRPQRAPEPPAPAEQPPAAEPTPPEAGDEIDATAEWERAEKDLQHARETIAALQKDDTTRELAALAEKYHRLDGRLQQEMRTRSEAEKAARYGADRLREIRKLLKVERDRDIIPAIQDLLR